MYIVHQMYIVHKEHLEEVLIDVSSVCTKPSKPSTAAGVAQPVPDARRSGCRKADAGNHHAYAADKAQVKGLKVSEIVGMERYGGYDFTVRHMGKCGYGAACQIVKVYFFSTQEYNICKNC